MPSLPTPGGDIGTWGAELNEYLTVAHKADGKLKDTFSVKNYGAVGDGTTDDTVAVQAALTAAAGAELFIPAGVYAISTALSYNCATLGPVTIRGAGAKAILKATGASNKVLHITGNPGITNASVILEKFMVQSATSGVCPAGIHLDGLAAIWLHDLAIDGGLKMTNGIQCTGSQQGEISGGHIHRCTTGIRLEPSGIYHSNGLDIHGVSLAATGTNLVVDQVDSLFFHSNHLVIAAIGVDIIQGGLGVAIIRDNHIESHTTAGVRATGQPLIVGNIFVPAETGTDIKLISGGTYAWIGENLLQGNVTIDAGVTDAYVFNNYIIGLAGVTFTDNGTRTTKIGNRGSIGASALGGVLRDSLSLTAREATAGDILKLNSNPSVGGAWGMAIAGTGAAEDVYLKLQDVVLAGSTSGGSLRVMSGVGGTEWARVSNGTISNGASGPKWIRGTGTPEANHIAPIGSFYSRTDGGAGTSFYVKEAGTGNTGWVAK